MDFISIEGADGTGKTTVHRGFYQKIGEDPDTGQATHKRVEGVVDRLAGKTGRPVYPTREPGTLPLGDGEDWWDPPGLLDVESHLNTALQWMGVAWEKAPEDSQARHVIEAAAFVAHYDELPADVFSFCKPGGERSGTFLQEWRRLKSNWARLFTLAEADSTVRNRLETYCARDALRHAIIGAEDSHEFSTTASGLLFFAGHLLHARWLDTLPEAAIVVSDRAGESQLAYGRAREDDPRIEELYLSERPIEPDLVLCLTCDEEEIKERLGLREKEENKSWGLKQIVGAQEAYHDLSDELTAPFYFLDTTGRDEKPVIEEAAEVLEMAIDFRSLEALPHKE